MNTSFSSINSGSLNIWRAVLGLALLWAVVGCQKPGRQTEAGDSRFLIQEGRALSEIVITENPPRVVRFASGELQTYLKKITGVELPIVNEPSGGEIIPIFVGISPHTEKLGLSTEGLRHGAFRMAAGEDWLALLGPDRDFEPVEPWGRSRGAAEANRVHEEFKTITGKPFASNMSRLSQRYEEELDIWETDDLGTSNAVYTFLESLGVRWFAPGELGQVVPQLASIALPEPQNEAVKPDFALRSISFGYKHLGLPELTLWMMRLRANSAGDLIGLTQHCHGMRFVHERDEMKKLHPEIYAIWDGKSQEDHRGGQGAPSLGQPILFDLHLQYARAMFDHYGEPMISIDVVDGTGRNICDRDQHLAEPERGSSGALSNYVWGYLDRVARELYQSHPDRMVSGLAYSAYFDPPTNMETMSPNLALFQARWRSNFHDREYYERMRNNREEWLKKLPSGMLFLHEYYLFSRDGAPGLPVFIPTVIAEDLRELKGKSMGEIIEVYCHNPNLPHPGWDEFAINHLNIYVTLQLLWNVDQSVEELLQDYYTKYYGPAAAPMQAFIEFCEANWPLMSQQAEPIQTALDLLEKARAAAPDGTPYAERVQRVVDYLGEQMPKLIATLNKKRADAPPYRVLRSRDVMELGTTMAMNTMDGILEPQFWPEVRRSTLRDSMTGSASKFQTTFQAIREGDFIYVAFRCEEPDMENPAIGTTENNDPKIFDGDFVSLIIETGSHSYYEIVVNPAGAVYEIDRGEGGTSEWLSGSTIGVHRDDNAWSVEMRIPIMGAGARTLDPIVGIDGNRPSDMFPWFFNAGRQRVRGETTEFLSIFPTGQPDLHNLEAAGKMWGK